MTPSSRSCRAAHVAQTSGCGPEDRHRFGVNADLMRQALVFLKQRSTFTRMNETRCPRITTKLPTLPLKGGGRRSTGALLIIRGRKAERKEIEEATRRANEERKRQAMALQASQTNVAPQSRKWPVGWILLAVGLLAVIIWLATRLGGTPVSPAPTQAPAAASAPQIVEPTKAPGRLQLPADRSSGRCIVALQRSARSGRAGQDRHLPPVDARLPDEPLVTTPVESVGKYGGTLYTASWWPEAGNVQLYFAVEAPVKWKADLTGYEPALVKSYEFSADGKTFTMHMRKGMKWSDGEPYTSADWKFWWEDLGNAPDQKLYSIPAYLRNTDGTPITMEFPDNYTVVWKADRSLAVNANYMAQGYWEFAKGMMKPAHYLKQFHPKYTPTAKWEDMERADKWWQTAGYPCIFAWCNTAVSTDGTRYTYTRNPYFWPVDTEGNQLPYIDAIDVEIVSDEQVRLLNVIQGKYNTAFPRGRQPQRHPVDPGERRSRQLQTAGRLDERRGRVARLLCELLLRRGRQELRG